MTLPAAHAKPGCRSWEAIGRWAKSTEVAARLGVSVWSVRRNFVGHTKSVGTTNPGKDGKPPRKSLRYCTAAKAVNA